MYIHFLSELILKTHQYFLLKHAHSIDACVRFPLGCLSNFDNDKIKMLKKTDCSWNSNVAAWEAKILTTTVIIEYCLQTAFFCVELKDDLESFFSYSSLPYPNREDNYWLTCEKQPCFEKKKELSNGYVNVLCWDRVIAYQLTERTVNATHL